MTLSGFLIIMALILLGTALYSINSRQRFDEDFSRDMKNLMDEANLVRKDLEAVLENAVYVSGNMIETLDDRLEQLENTHHRNHGSSSKESSRRNPISNSGPKMKIEELRRAHPYIAVPRLFNEGYSVSEIAEILEKGQGEIKLIIDLHKKREVGS